MNRKQYVYRTNDGWWLYEVWYGRAVSVIGRADTRGARRAVGVARLSARSIGNPQRRTSWTLTHT